MACVTGITKDNVDYIMDMFIDIDNVRAIAGKLNNIADAQVENWIAALETEMQGGGLDPYALNIGGDPILNTNAGKITNNLKQRKAMLEDVNTKIVNIAKRHRQAELKKLEEVAKQIIEEKEARKVEIRAAATENNETLDEKEGWDAWFGKTYREEIAACDERIKEMEALLTKIHADECYDFIGGE